MLYRPAQPVVQQRPYPGGMMAHPGQPLDDQPDAVKGSTAPHEPVRGCPVQAGLFHLLERSVSWIEESYRIVAEAACVAELGSSEQRPRLSPR
jgi:hypothetical protein